MGVKQLDRFDRKILDLLQADANLSLAELSKRVGLSATPCWKRIQRLEADGVITGKIAVVCPEKVGLGLTAFISIETGDHSPAWHERHVLAISALPEVMDFYRMAGDVDHLLRVVVRDMEAFDAFYKRLVAAAPMRNVTSRFSMERIKASTVLPLSISETA